MNGIVPGPLWLAIASAVNNPASENGTLIQQSKIDTLTGKTDKCSKDFSDFEKKGIGSDVVVPESAMRSDKREGG